MSLGQVRVGRYQDNTYAQYDGFTSIPVIMKSHNKKWFPLSPYSLTDENGYIMENIWQFSKIYDTVPKSRQIYSRYDSTVIWEYGQETHMQNGTVLDSYWNWRRLGFSNEYPVRYPVGFRNKSKVVGSVFVNLDGTIEILDYITARIKIYLAEYVRLVKQRPEFYELRDRLHGGENLLIQDPDGPHQESLQYYKDKYNVSDTFIEHDTVVVTVDSMNLLIKDSKHSFGHGYCLAGSLLGLC